MELKWTPDIKKKQKILEAGCPLDFYLVFANLEDIILVKYRTVHYYSLNQALDILNKCQHNFSKNLTEWHQEKIRRINLKSKITLLNEKYQDYNIVAISYDDSLVINEVLSEEEYLVPIYYVLQNQDSIIFEELEIHRFNNIDEANNFINHLKSKPLFYESIQKWKQKTINNTYIKK